MKALKLTAVSAATIALFVQLVAYAVAGNYVGAATALVGIILAYNPALADILEPLKPYLPGWIAWLFGLLANLPALLRKLVPTPPPTPPSPHA